MDDRPVVVVDTNVLLNLATPVVDSRSVAPSGKDILKIVLTIYDVHVPESVLGEVTAATGDDDLLSVAADAVLQASDSLTTHDVDTDILEEPVMVGLDRGESEGIQLANELDAEMFVTDEFNSTNYLVISQAIDDQNTLFTTPHVLCSLARHGILDPRYVDTLLTYFAETKGWDKTYLDALRETYL